MTNNRYQQEVTEGAKQILEEVHVLARTLNLSVDAARWDEGEFAMGKNPHVLTISKGDKTVQGNFFESVMADFPPKISVKRTREKLEQLLRQLNA